MSRVSQQARSRRRSRLWSCGLVTAATSVAIAAATWPMAADQLPQVAFAAPRTCRIRGVVKSGEAALPGVAISVREGDVLRAVTSTDVDGTYTVAVGPGAYVVRVELSAFATREQTVTLGATTPCESTMDATLMLVSRTPGGALPPVAAVPTPVRGAGPAGPNPAAGPGGRGRVGSAAPASSIPAP
jgi:hypothetical protein